MIPPSGGNPDHQAGSQGPGARIQPSWAGDHDGQQTDQPDQTQTSRDNQQLKHGTEYTGDDARKEGEEAEA